MPNNDFAQFATTTANLMTTPLYKLKAPIGHAMKSIADSAMENKALFQLSLISCAWAETIVEADQDANDTDSITQVKDKLIYAIQSAINSRLVPEGGIEGQVLSINAAGNSYFRHITEVPTTGQLGGYLIKTGAGIDDYEFIIPDPGISSNVGWLPNVELLSAAGSETLINSSDIEIVTGDIIDVGMYLSDTNGTYAVITDAGALANTWIARTILTGVSGVPVIMLADPTYVSVYSIEITVGGSGYAVGDLVHITNNGSTVNFEVLEVGDNGSLLSITSLPNSDEGTIFNIANDPSGIDLLIVNDSSSGSGGIIKLRTSYLNGNYEVLGTIVYTTDSDPLTQRTYVDGRINNLAQQLGQQSALGGRHIFPDNSWAVANIGNYNDIPVGNFTWNSQTGVLRSQLGHQDEQSYGDYRDCIIYEQMSISGGSVNYNTQGGSRVGVRYIVAWSSGESDWPTLATKDVPGEGTIQLYLTIGKSDSSYSSQDALAPSTDNSEQSFSISDITTPIGLIAMWYGTIETIPAAWALCDGTNDTPNLLDKFPYFHNPITDSTPQLASGSDYNTCNVLPIMRHNIPGYPLILVQPKDKVANVGEGCQFIVTVNGNPPLVYQWYLNGSPITGANQRTLSIYPIENDMDGNEYYCIISNGEGTATTNTVTLDVVQGHLYSIDSQGGVLTGGSPAGYYLENSTINLPTGATHA